MADEAGVVMNTRITIQRSHSICVGHRVMGHESKCKFLHGHNLVVDFTLTAPCLDSVGRVLDFGVVKQILCMWLETNWDHRMLLWSGDPLVDELAQGVLYRADKDIAKAKALLGIVTIPVNPTAENLAHYLLTFICPAILDSGVQVVSVSIHETDKCLATATLV